MRPVQTEAPYPTPLPKVIAIAGGGFAGVTLAQRLLPLLPPGWHVLLLSEESYTTFNPMLPEVVGAGVFPEHVVAPIREMVPRVRFVMGRVSSVDRDCRSLVCETLEGPVCFHYDELVLALGLRANLDIVPGMAQHALPLKLIGDALHIRNRVLQSLARIELADAAHKREALGHFVVVGGGFSGVEAAGALADFLHSARRWYPRVAASGLRITLLHDGDCLLPELPASLGRAAQRSLERRGVVVRLSERACEVQEGGVRLASGERLRAMTTLCTVGTRPHALVQALGLPLERGRIVTQADGAAAPGVWALGDCAATRNAHPAHADQLCPPTAQFAVAQAQQLAVNLCRHLAGQPTHPFAFKARGSLATTGHLRGVAQVFGVRLAGLPAWLLWRAFYLMRMPTLGRKLRIWVEWTWSLFFPLDITHLRFTRSAERDALDL